jgi:hypothetical protein
MIFFLLHFAQDLSCLFRRLDFPPKPSPIKVISMKKEEDGIFGFPILIKIFRQDDKKPFLLTQGFRKKGFIPNQVLKLLGGLGREKIRKFRILWATEMVGREGFGITDEEEKAANPGQANPVPSSGFHQSQYIPKEASLQPLLNLASAFISDDILYRPQ